MSKWKYGGKCRIDISLNALYYLTSAIIDIQKRPTYLGNPNCDYVENTEDAKDVFVYTSLLMMKSYS
jgi:hypothetical protein